MILDRNRSFAITSKEKPIYQCVGGIKRKELKKQGSTIIIFGHNSVITNNETACIEFDRAKCF